MTRVLTAAALVIVIAGSLAAPPWVFLLLIAAVTVQGWREYSVLAAEAGATPLHGFGPILGLGCALSFASPQPGLPMVVLAVAMLAAAAAGLLAGHRHPALATRRTLATWAGIIWLGVMPGFQIGIRNHASGVAWLALLYLSVSAGDIAAYYGGRRFGRRPLAPDLSPKKTVEGSIFGLVASAGAAGGFALVWLEGPGTGPVLVAGLLMGAIGQVGDLIESSLKRAARTKDSSALLPGHGGILDRVDGHLFAGSLLWVLLASGLL